MCSGSFQKVTEYSAVHYSRVMISGVGGEGGTNPESYKIEFSAKIPKPAEEKCQWHLNFGDPEEGFGNYS
ncbi:hypothetical protein E2C01_049455 [Portunus trituberculatus]|uniref:Uncharacterized protein n=1 Tax=Portunus trituberculatus TaxID=210409 RepID=A0A5B7GDX8_PORTR|nr:hypothetical protein [Portunus trituberculatus]